MADWEIITLLLCFCLLFVALVGLMEVLSKRYLPRDPFGKSDLVAAGGVVVALVLSGFTTALVKKEFFGGREAQVFEKGIRISFSAARPPQRATGGCGAQWASRLITPMW